MTPEQLIDAIRYNKRRWQQGHVYPLAMLGWLQIAVPPSAGPGTVEEAQHVAAWQQAQRLEVDGKLGPATCDTLHLAGLRRMGRDTGEWLSPHFGRDEFDCNDGTVLPLGMRPNARATARLMEVVRHEVCGDRSITIVSGWRSEAHNRKSKGASGSLHLTAQAVDWRCDDLELSLAEIRAEVDRLMRAGRIPMGGSQHYPQPHHRWLHTDWRGGPSPKHWDKTAGVVPPVVVRPGRPA